MPDRIISPPMVGVPALVIRCDLRAVGADRLALALAQAQMVDDPGPEQEHEHQRGDHRAAGAERDVTEHVENVSVPEKSASQ